VQASASKCKGQAEASASKQASKHAGLIPKECKQAQADNQQAQASLMQVQTPFAGLLKYRTRFLPTP
jgi:hypothetical protein